MNLYYELIFFTCIFIVFYVYLGYPFTLIYLSSFKNRTIQKETSFPNVTILTAAYNEAEHIAKTISNKLESDYPPEKIEIIVISDKSTDGTDKIVRSIDDARVKLVRQEPRAGKTAALNLAVQHANGEILIFSDANSIWDSKAIVHLVRNFSDSTVGYVTGKMIYVNETGNAIGDGCSAYMKYENNLRRYETLVGSVVGVDGGIDAVRAKLYRPMNPDQLPDFVLPLNVYEQGYRVVYEPEALLKESSLESAEDEYRMRVRVTLRALWALKDMSHLLSLKRYGLFAFQLWVHKVLRYMCFLFLILAYVSNFLLLPQGAFYKFIFFAQTIFYSTGIFHPILEKRMKLRGGLRLPGYFLLLNVASAHAFLKFLFLQKQVIWTPRKG